LDCLINGYIERAIDALTGGDRPRLLSPQLARHICEQLAHRVREAARSESVMELMTADDVAERLGITPRRVRQLAASLGVGWNTGRDWIFRNSDLDALRARSTKPGRRPRTGETATD
jgi:hypothetical protein